MRTLSSIAIFICLAANALGQNEIKFQVEELSAPEKALYTTDINDVYQPLILSDAHLPLYRAKGDTSQFRFNIITQSNAPDSLVCFGYHSFFNGMYQAYADHRPFVLSPDMIWLLISQGFARHLSANSESLRHHFVDFDGKLSLVLESKQDLLDTGVHSKDWETIFPQFTAQIATHTGEELMTILSSNFSTTTAVEKVAAEITIMEAMEPYFEFVVINIVCGIPEITLTGTPEDWQKVYNKAQKLAAYDLEWWTSELAPLLQEFIKTSQGDIDTIFWQNMFKYHSQKKYGAPKIIDGWIVKFFPYNKKGQRNNLKELSGSDNLPEEVVKVDLKYIESSGNTTQTTNLELWAGFIGLEQDPRHFTLTPQIGWMIRKKNNGNTELKKRFEKEAITEGFGSGIDIRVKEIPEILYALDSIKELKVLFIDSINVSERLKELSIKRLELRGKTNTTEVERINQMFPNTQLIINGKEY